MKRLLSLLNLCIIILLASCNPFDNSPKPAEEIDAISSVGIGRLSLKLYVDAYIPAGKYCLFKLEKPFYQIKKELEEKNSKHRFQLLEDAILVDQNYNNAFISYGIFPTNVKNNIFVPLEIQIQDVEVGHNYHTIIAPIHYSKVFKEAATYFGETHHFPLKNEWYPMESNENDFIQFYEDSNLFLIQKAEGKYKVRLKDISNPQEKINHYIEWFYIEFKEEHGINFVKYNLIIE